MKANGKRVGFYAISGVLAAVLIISGLLMSGIQLPSMRAMGTLMVLITDAPVDLDHLNVTIDSLMVRNVADENESWTSIPFSNGREEVYFDLLALRNVTMELSISEIPSGNYSKIRMTIKTANATYASGETVDLIVPPGRVDVKIDFEIKSDETTVLLIDMEADWVAISKTNRLRPVLKASVAQQP